MFFSFLDNIKNNSKKNKFFICLIFLILGISVSFLLNVNLSYATLNEDIERRNMLVDTAFAYQRKGSFYQYDLYRENKFLAPESINEYNNSFAVCSTYVFQVYYNTLGIRIPILSKNHLSNASKLNQNNTNKYIRYYTSSDVEKLSGNSLIDKLLKFEENSSTFLEKGDVVTIGYGSNGHTMMVYSVDNNEVFVIDNNGSVYDYKNKEEKFEEGGSINIHRLSDLLKSFINNDKYTFSAVSFIKIIADGKYLSFNNGSVKQLAFPNNDLSKAGKVRYKYKEMDVEKTYFIKNNDCSLTNSLYVNFGGEITYNITIKNNSDIPYSGMKIVEDIDTGKVSFLSSDNGIYNNGKVIFSNIYVAGKSSITLSYTVKVDNNLENIYGVIESTGSIDDFLKLKNVNIYIGNALSNYQKDILLSNYSKISSATSDGKDYISKVYKESFNFDLVFDNYISYENNTKYVVKNTKLNNSSNMVMANLYGLETSSADNSSKNLINIYNSWRYWTSDNVVTSDPKYLLEYKNRPRNLSYNMLETGDIILTDSKAYLYINYNGVHKLIFNSEEYMDKSVDKFLQDLVGNDYVILRPSLSEKFPKKTYKITFKADEVGVSNIPSEVTYVYSNIDNCKFPISNNVPKREGYVFDGWMLESNNALVFPAGVNWKQSNARDYVLIALWKKIDNTDSEFNDKPNDKDEDNNVSSNDKGDNNHIPDDKDDEKDVQLDDGNLYEENNIENIFDGSEISKKNNKRFGGIIIVGCLLIAFIYFYKRGLLRKR